MKKKRMFFLITLTAGMLLFTACAGQESKTGQQAESDYKEVTLFCDVEFWDAPMWDSSENSISGKISEETGAVIEVIDTMEDADKQLSIMLANDKLPDMISVTDGTVISQLITSGKVWNLEEFLQKYKPDSHLLEDFPEDIKYELIKRDGGWYAYPSHMSSPDNRENRELSEYYLKEIEYNWNFVIIWNKALVQELGLDMQELQKEEQVFAAFEKAKNTKTAEGETILPFLMDGESYRQSTLYFLAHSFGAEYVDEDGNYMDYFRQPEMKEAMEFLNTAIRCGYAAPEQLMYDNDRVKKLLEEDNVLCFIGNLANTGVDPALWESSGVILSDTGSAPVFAQNLRRTTGWINTFIARDCESPETVAELLDYMTSEEGQLEWVYGTPGVHYTYNQEGKLVMTEEGIEAQGNYVQSGVNVWWMFFNLDWSRSVVADPEEDSDSTLANNIGCVYALDEKTHCYDGTALQYLNEDYIGDREYEQIEEEIEKWKQEQTKQVILAKTAEEFEAEYGNLIQGLKDRRIEKLDDKKNEQYQRNCKEYDVFIEKVN